MMVWVFILTSFLAVETAFSTELVHWKMQNRSRSIDRCLGFKDIYSKKGIIGNCEFRLMATVSSPIASDGKTKLQANAIALDHQSLAYVSYNLAGDGRMGALEIIDFKKVKTPKILSVVLFKDSEFSSVSLKKFRMKSGEIKSVLLLSGAEGTGKRWGAIIQMVDVTNPSAPVRLASIEVPGYYATQVQWGTGTNIWVSSGDNAGLFELKLQQPESIGESNEATWAVEKKFPLLNSIAFALSRGIPFVLGGNKNSALYSPNGNSLENRLEIARFALDAPAGVTSTENLLYINGGASGFHIAQISKNNHLAELAKLSVPGDGNGVDSFERRSRKLTFLAQGDAGLIVVDSSKPSKPFVIGNWDFPDQGSANAVKALKHFHGSLVVLVSDGLGGLRFIERKARKFD